MANSQVYKGGSPQITNHPSKAHNKLFSLAWVICGILTILVPLIFRSLKMNNYNKMYYMYNWEQAQQQYEQQQEYYNQMNDNGNYMNSYGQGGYQYQWEQMRGTYDINQCKWYQFNCFPYYINENGEPEPAAGWYPAWFSGWTQTEEERDQMMEAGQTSPSQYFVYVWQIIMFVVILTYGFIVIKQNRVVTGVTVALIVFTNMAFLSMWLLADGSIVVDGDYVQRTGFYGQFSVLMFITNAWYVIFGLIFSAIFAIRGHSMHSVDDSKQKETQIDANAQSYKPLGGDSPTTKRPVLI